MPLLRQMGAAKAYALQQIGEAVFSSCLSEIITPKLAPNASISELSFPHIAENFECGKVPKSPANSEGSCSFAIIGDKFAFSYHSFHLSNPWDRLQLDELKSWLAQSGGANRVRKLAMGGRTNIQPQDAPSWCNRPQKTCRLPTSSPKMPHRHVHPQRGGEEEKSRGGAHIKSRDSVGKQAAYSLIVLIDRNQACRREFHCNPEGKTKPLQLIQSLCSLCAVFTW